MEETQKEGKKKNRVVLIIALVGLLLISSGIGYSLVFDKSNEEPSKDINEMGEEKEGISAIEKSKRDAFTVVAQSYLDSVKNSVLADGVKCKDAVADEWKVVSSFGAGEYYFLLATDSSMLTSGLDENTGKNVLRQTFNLMETGGKSSWDDAEIAGFVYWEKTGAGIETRSVYKVALADSAKHGIAGSFEGGGAEDRKITRSSVSPSNVEVDLKAIYDGTVTATADTIYYCELNY